jgi:hypothetical protein
MSVEQGGCHVSSMSCRGTVIGLVQSSRDILVVILLRDAQSAHPNQMLQGPIHTQQSRRPMLNSQTSGPKLSTEENPHPVNWSMGPYSLGSKVLEQTDPPPLLTFQHFGSMRHVVLLPQTLHSALMMRQQMHQEHGRNTTLLGTALPLLDEVHHADHDLGQGQHLVQKVG